MTGWRGICNPFGLIELENSGSETLTDLRLSFFINTYMDSPKTFARVGRGEGFEAEVLALFNNRILTVTGGKRIRIPCPNIDIIPSYSVI